MMRHGLTALILIGTVACTARPDPASMVSEAPPPVEPLASVTPALLPADDLDRAVLAAIRRDAEHCGLGARAEARGLAALDAGRPADPELRLGTDLLHERWDDDEYQAGVRWRPPRPGERASARAYADARTGRARAEAGLRALLIEETVHDAWLAAWTSERRVAVARRLAVLERERTGLVEQLTRIGTRTAVDRTVAQVRSAEAGARCERLEREQRDAHGRLTMLIGGPATAISMPTLPSADAPANSTTPAWTEAEAAEAEARAEARQERIARMLWPTFIEGGIEMDATGRYQGTMARVGVQLPLPGGDGAQRGAELAAEAHRRRQELVQRHRIDDLARLRTTYAEARRSADDLRRRIDALAEGCERLGRETAAQGTDPLAPIEMRERLLRLEGEAVEWEVAVLEHGLALRRLVAPVAGTWR